MFTAITLSIGMKVGYRFPWNDTFLDKLVFALVRTVSNIYLCISVDPNFIKDRSQSTCQKQYLTGTLLTKGSFSLTITWSGNAILEYLGMWYRW